MAVAKSPAVKKTTAAKKTVAVPRRRAATSSAKEAQIARNKEAEAAKPKPQPKPRVPRTPAQTQTRQPRQKRTPRPQVPIDPRMDTAIQTAIGALTAVILSEGAKVTAVRMRLGYRIVAITHADGMRHVLNIRSKSVVPGANRRGGPVRIRRVADGDEGGAEE